MSQTSVPVIQPPSATRQLGKLDGVRTRRVIAFLIDACFIFAIAAVLMLAMLLLAIPTFGVTFAFMPLIPFVGVIYNGLTISGPKMSTWGMRMQGLMLTHRDGTRVDFIFAAGHALLFWLSNGILTPVILLQTPKN